MSNPFKAIGKAFKAVVKVIKKVALPVLAIGAVVLTGGAALGVLPSVGALGSSLGLSAGLTSVLSTAATSATIGAVGSALTGGNILKVATTGFVAGAALGGFNAAIGGAAKAGTAAADAASSGASGAGNAASTFAERVASAPGLDVISNGSLSGGGLASRGLGTALGGSSAASGLAAATGAGGGVLAPVVASAAPVSSGSGILGFINSNPVVSGMALQGLGQGMLAREQSKEAQRNRDAIAANYADTSGLPTYSSPSGGLGGPNASEVFNAAIYAGKKVSYDPSTGRINVGS
ncbi:hypothetical protein F1640_18290 [Novosphingobium sp. NBM11]|uniref:hypothetical protein n=1 Tax=Novosphingobium sp. NBM11 TaxID=2596914 RepID=UPI001892559A|nr:hypothetical protein [Novosphingobium sp. NBM11]MBF5091905.1 hypothetical protein [Novosphingobium sp. NBM11]